MTTKNRILLLANYRTGSSDYCDTLSKINNATFLPEPHLYEKQYRLLKQIVFAGKPFVVKFMPDQIAEHPIYDKILNSNCYKIKLTRDNKIDQIASYYIASMTKIWNSTDIFSRGEKYTVEISHWQIRKAIDIISKNDNLFKTLDIKFDEELTYENLVDNNLLGRRLVKILEPTNILDIKKVIEVECK